MKGVDAARSRRLHQVRENFRGLPVTSICIATRYDASFRDIGDFAAMTLRYYAHKHGHTAFVDDNLSPVRPASWHKVTLILDLFDQGFEFVMWVDADAIFARFDVDIASVITKSHDLYLVQHNHPISSPPLVPNAGVMLVRNCAWSREIFGRVWEMDQYLDHPWWENAAIIKLLGYNSLIGEGKDTFADDVLARVRFLDEVWNFVSCSIYAGKEPIIRHYAGYSNDYRRQEIPRQALAACFRALQENYRSRNGVARRVRSLARGLRPRSPG